MGFYSSYVFPCLCEWALNSPQIAKLRRELLRNTYGDVLEIGFGSGLNLPHYTKQVRQLTAIDPNPGMHRKAARRLAESAINVETTLASCEQLPFEPRSFDFVVSTFTLCSIDDVAKAMAEVHRVLRSGGSFLCLEHGLSRDAKVQRWQRRLNWLQQRLAGNCHLDRNIRELVGRQRFAEVNLTEFYLEHVPRTHGAIYLGTAKK